MCTAIKHPVPDRVKPSFVIFDIRALWHWVLKDGWIEDTNTCKHSRHSRWKWLKMYKNRLLIQNGYCVLRIFLLIASTVADVTSRSTYSLVSEQRRHSLLFRSSVSNKRLRCRTQACLRFNDISSRHNLHQSMSGKLDKWRTLLHYQTQKCANILHIFRCQCEWPLVANTRCECLCQRCWCCTAALSFNEGSCHVTGSAP